MLTPATHETANVKVIGADFWLRLFNDEALRDCGDLEKLVIGCEIIAACEAVAQLAA